MLMFRNFEEVLAGARARGAITIAVAAGHDPDAIEALKRARELGLGEGILVGNGAKIRALADEAGLDLDASQVINEPDDGAAIRQSIALVRERRAGLLMKGKVATASLIRAVLDKDGGLRTGRLLSQSIVVQAPGFDRLMIITDAAINIAPTLAQKAEICRNAIQVARALGIDTPNIAAEGQSLFQQHEDGKNCNPCEAHHAADKEKGHQGPAAADAIEAVAHAE